MTRLSRAVWVPAAALMLATTGAAPATADGVLTISPKATLVARGVAADIQLMYRCSPTAEMDAGAFGLLSEALRHQDPTSAFGAIDLTCDGKSHSEVLRVAVEDWDPVLKPGPAVLRVELTGTNDPPLHVWWQDVRLVRKG